MNQYITNELFTDFLSCNYKFYLKLQSRVGEKSEYEELQIRLMQEYRIKAYDNLFKSKFKDTAHKLSYALPELIIKKPKLAANLIVSNDEISVQINAVVQDSKCSSIAYIPVLFIHRERIFKADKLLLALHGLVLSEKIGDSPIFGRIIHGYQFTSKRIRLDALITQANDVLRAILKIKYDDVQPPHFYLNRQCNTCSYKTYCRSVAIKNDDLSLLAGLKPKNIRKLNEKGIFTVTQYSYTFRPRRNRKRSKNFKMRYHPELKALAIREHKIYVYETPKLPQSKVNIYFDVEGIPDKTSYYLIGVLVEKANDVIEEFSFWANDEKEELNIFQDLINMLDKYDNYTLYHYGNYEKEYLTRMNRKMNMSEKKKVENILQHCCNLLSFFRTNIYLPTYTNELKEIGKYLGYEWSDKLASGIKSIVWRTKWESNKSNLFKRRLEQYNKDDCYALVPIRKLIELIIRNDNECHDDINNNLEGTVYCKDIKTSSVFRPEIVIPEMKFITKCSYFDYQRERVFVRSSNYFKKLQKKKEKRKSVLKPNKTFKLISKVCPICKSKDIVKRENISKKIVDLKFTNSGIKKWIIRLDSNRYYCKNCNCCRAPLRYKKAKFNSGHGLMCWAIYHQIVNRESDRQIEKNLYELFGLIVPHDSINRFKSYLAEYYKPTYNLLTKKVLSNHVLYADETPIKTKFEDAYAWVFTNNREVVSFYKPTREGSFLQNFLKNFTGILVTDFYLAYDSIDCLHQKCLIHLMRDFNDDILKNPFNNEFKKMAHNFTIVLQNIVKTIDRYGLKKRHLKKHRKEAAHYIRSISQAEFESEIAKQYKSRIKKYKNALFQFLNHDNVSWSNSNAEHAIKLLATHTNKNIWFFQSKAVDEYLLLLSIYQTCEYNNISFLKFLLSQERNLVEYIHRNI